MSGYVSAHEQRRPHQILAERITQIAAEYTRISRIEPKSTGELWIQLREDCQILLLINTSRNIPIEDVPEVIAELTKASGHLSVYEIQQTVERVTKDLEQRLSRAIGTKVEVRDQGNRGEIAIPYADLDALDRILDKLI